VDGLARHPAPGGELGHPQARRLLGRPLLPLHLPRPRASAPGRRIEIDDPDRLGIRTRTRDRSPQMSPPIWKLVGGSISMDTSSIR